MKILFTTVRAASHLAALIPFIEACRQRGHQVAIAASAEFAIKSAQLGAPFFPIAQPDAAEMRGLEQQLRSAPLADVHRLAVGELFAGAMARAAVADLMDVLRAWQPAVLVRETFEFAGFVAAQKLGIAHGRVAIVAPGAEWEALSYAAGPLDALRARLGLAPDPSGSCLQHERAVTLFPPAFAALRGAGPVRCRVERANAVALPDHWSGRADPFVYMTLGIIAGGAGVARARFRLLLDAVADLPLRVLLTTGVPLSSDVLGNVPSNVQVAPFVPQADLLPHAAASVCHGGSGTLLGALAAGVPMVITPMFADQPFNARAVQELGAGLALASEQTSAAQLRDALTRVLREPSYRDNAAALAKQMAALPALSRAVDEFERWAANAQVADHHAG